MYSVIFQIAKGPVRGQLSCIVMRSTYALVPLAYGPVNSPVRAESISK
jgi:hypothetical protein